MITDPMGQWKHPGKNTRIPGNNITMKGVNYPVLGVSNNGQEKMMFPGQEYIFPGAAYVDEFPQMKKGGRPRGLVPMPKPSKKGLASKKYSRSLDATNIIFAENPIYKKPKSRRNKIYNPNAKYYQAGGVTQLTPEEELQFSNFYNTLPENLQTDDPTYDIRGYWDALGRPQEFDYSQPKEKDGYYHAFSINPNTGEYLKSPAHPTFQHAVEEDRKIGYRPITNVYGRNIATEVPFIADPEKTNPFAYTAGPANYMDIELDEDEIDQYVKGGYVVEDISVPSLNTYQGGGDWAPSQDLGETTIYGDPKKRKWAIALHDQLTAAIRAYQNYTKEHQGKSWWFPKAERDTGSIEGLLSAINKYNSELAKAKEEVKAQRAEADRINKMTKANVTIKDLNKSPEKVKRKILTALNENRSNMATSDISGLYRDYNLADVDTKTIEGSGPNAQFSAKELQQKGMYDVPGFVNKVAKAAQLATGFATAGALGGAGAAGGGLKGLGEVVANPVVQGAMIAPTVAEVVSHPQDTITGAITTGVEIYDKLTGDKDDVNRFGNPYWQDMNHLINTLVLFPGIGTVAKAREFIKTPAGFNWAANYIKPVKDVYKTGVKTFRKTVKPVLQANVPKYTAATADLLTGGRGATEVVNKAGQLLQGMPAWAEPTVANALKATTIGTGVQNIFEGGVDVQKALQEGDKEKFDESIAKVTDGATSVASAKILGVEELSNITTPLVVKSAAEDLKEDVENNNVAKSEFDLLRLMNSISNLPISTTQILPTKTVKAFKKFKPRRIRKNIQNKKQDGGIVTSLSQKEIDNLIKQGYIIEELD